MISIALSAMFVATVVASRMTVGLIDMSISLGTSDTTLFNSELANIFAADFSAIPSLNSSIKLDNSLAVPVFMWFSGFPVDSRDATAQLLRSNFTVLWPVAGNLPLNLTLVDACTNVLGVAPTSISYSDECIYSSLAPSSWTTASPSATSFVDCERSVAFVLHFSNNVGGAIVKNYVCSSLEIDCSKIVVGSTTAISYSTGSTDVSGFQVLVNVSMIDPMEITSLLCDRAASASQLSFLYDLMISINGVMIFTRGSVIQDSSDGSFQDCMENLWYLLILILLVPISYVVTSMCYQRGKRRGRVVAQDQDEEAKEKAKQMLSQQNWQSLYFPQGTQGFGSMPSR
ncbi:membrane-associated protein, putative [Bodo saltans]|uniref:Membrane-associated protein, putative n=1 Tax=Bodo saltans TaxID=75058 RepID=A0A0S4IYQ4_BODSA|nr:membrane-associated protein, putative [Bodo saltans]|eukprot:CUG16243.1 membrane-associated protein, putative [Bodo saltans]